MLRSALVAGATGLVGSNCVRTLLERPEYGVVIAAVRSPLPFKHERLVEAPAVFHSLPVPRNADVFCALGTTIRKAGSREAFRKVDFDCVIELARHSLDAGALQFLVVSSIGADRPGSNFYLSVKAEMEAAVSAMGFRSLHIFRPSLLLGRRAEPRPAEQIGGAAARILRPLLAGRLRRYRPVEAAIVARAMAAAALLDKPGRNVHEYDDICRLAAGIS